MSHSSHIIQKQGKALLPVSFRVTEDEKALLKKKGGLLGDKCFCPANVVWR